MDAKIRCGVDGDKRCGGKGPAVERAEFPLIEAASAIDEGFSYLDGAATGQMANSVWEALECFEKTARANIHRGSYPLAAHATDLYEEARATVGAFLGGTAENVVFAHGATEALNLVALGWAAANLHPGDLVVVSEANHHSNIVPWLMLQDRIGVEVAFAPVLGSGPRAGFLDQDAWEALLSRRPRIVAFPHTSNVTGFTVDARELAAQAHQTGALVVLDCAQSAPHMELKLQDWGIDFAAVSAHKMYGPFGIGALWAAPELLEQASPLLGGGGMVGKVDAGGFTLAPVPQRFEAGTPNISGAVGFAAACGFLQSMDRAAEGRRTTALVDTVVSAAREMSGVRIAGAPDLGKRCAIVSVGFERMHPHDAVEALAAAGICARGGSHCAQPLHHRLGLPATVRFSFSAHSAPEEAHQLVEALAAIAEGGSL